MKNLGLALWFIAACPGVYIIPWTNATVDLGGNLRLLETLESFGVLLLNGIEFIDGSPEMVIGHVGVKVIELRQRLLFVQEIQLLPESDNVRVIVFVLEIFVPIAWN